MGRISLRARLARLGFRFLIKRGGGQTLEQSRRQYAAMERLIPRPPRRVSITEVAADGLRLEAVRTPLSRADRCILYLHGGAYRVGSPVIYRHMTWRFADAVRAGVIVPDYRLAPEHPFPAALEDAATAYRWILARAVTPRQIVLMGDSAGGGLALGLAMMLRDRGDPTPGALVLMSPWTDLALTGASLKDNAEADPMLTVSELPQYAADYLGAADPRTPYASPLYGDARGLPPTLIQVGSDEILRDDAVRMAAKMRDAGGVVELDVAWQMPHVWQSLVPVVPEATAAFRTIGRFVNQQLA